MRRRFGFRLALLVPLLAALPLAALGDARADAVHVAHPQIAVEKYKLANGLEVILHEDHRTPIVTTNIWYHVGSKDEAPHRNGFAHLFEHVMFQGSKHVPEDTYFRYLERVGASDINGTTANDRTNYFETVPSNRLELALWLESDRMGFLLDHVDQKTFDSQREVVKNERRQSYENAPYGLVVQYINNALFPPNHPYHFLAIGTAEDLDRATLDDVKNFFRTWYVPNNATLVVAGDFDKTKTKALIEKYFAPIPGATLPARNPAPPVTLGGETVLDVAANVELGRLYLAWPTPAFFAPGDGELDLLAHILTAGKTSRLYKRLVYDEQIASDVSAYQESGLLASHFEIQVTARAGHTAAEIQRVVDDELAKVRANGVTPDEVARAQTTTLSGHIFRLERDASRADMLNMYNAHTGDPQYLDRDLARYENATAAGVRDAARNLLPADKRVVTLVTPSTSATICGDLVSSRTSPKGATP